MSTLWLSVASELPKAVGVMPGEGPFVFTSKRPGFQSPIETTISAAGDEIESKARLEVSADLASALEHSVDGADVSDEVYQEYLKAFRTLASTSLTLLRLLRQETHMLDLLLDDSIAGNPPGARWSHDGSNWQHVTVDRYSASVSVKKVNRLSRQFQSWIQDLLDAAEEPLLAYDHLAEANRSFGARFKWVEATVAAELAIKEILVRVEPKLSTLLLEVPSPPLDTLYGRVLEAAVGVRSPYLRELQTGSKRRNRIVHKIESIEPDHQETLEYVATVEKAIDHLLGISRAHRRQGRTFQG
jgi:hypothetical protein